MYIDICINIITTTWARGRGSALSTDVSRPNACHQPAFVKPLTSLCQLMSDPDACHHQAFVKGGRTAGHFKVRQRAP